MTIAGHLPGMNILYTQYSEYREKRKEYYQRQCDIKNYDHFLKRVSESVDSNVNSFNAPKRIKPLGLNFGVNKQEVVLELGKPDYILIETGLDHHQVLFYKKRSLGHSYLLQIHFVNGRMVYAMNGIRNVSSKRGNFFMKITSMILKKYLLNSYEELNVHDAEICDDFNNRVIINETLGLSIRFIDGSKEFREFLTSRITKSEVRKETAETASLDSLFIHI